MEGTPLSLGKKICPPGALRLAATTLALLLAVSPGFAQNPGSGGAGPRPAGPGGPGQPPPPPPPPTAGAKLEIVEGSSASYKVNEQLVGISFPNDAIGTSTTVAGNMTITPDGAIAPGGKLTVDLRNLKSDQEQRDNYIKNRVFDAEKYPMAEFVPSRITGLPTMIPFQGQTGFELTGNMTIHGVTKEVTFRGIATFNRDGTIAGRGQTSFTFETFGLPQPKIQRLMSVGDKIDLDVVFKFKRS
jgi:polyisoprenoid-binding protein YceI